MNGNMPSPIELVGTLSDLRAGHRLSNANFNIFRKRLLANGAKEVNIELYRRDLISSRQFNTNEVAIERDRRLEAAAKDNGLAARSTAKKARARLPERKAA